MVVENLEEIIKKQFGNTIKETNFPALGELYKGKVRDNYMKEDIRIIIATDRISSFDRVITTIPFKGQMLNQISAFWFKKSIRCSEMLPMCMSSFFKTTASINLSLENHRSVPNIMHELSITQSILSIVVEQAKKAQASKITNINLTIGELEGIVDDCVQFYFDIISKDTIAAEASLSFNRPPARLRCRNCNTTFLPDDLNWTCPNCQKQKVEIISGRECYVESIEVD